VGRGSPAQGGRSAGRPRLPLARESKAKPSCLRCTAGGRAQGRCVHEQASLPSDDERPR
jgi:hypothetical protein